MPRIVGSVLIWLTACILLFGLFFRPNKASQRNNTPSGNAKTESAVGSDRDRDGIGHPDVIAAIGPHVGKTASNNDGKERHYAVWFPPSKESKNLLFCGFLLGVFFCVGISFMSALVLGTGFWRDGCHLLAALFVILGIMAFTLAVFLAHEAFGSTFDVNTVPQKYQLTTLTVIAIGDTPIAHVLSTEKQTAITAPEVK